MFFSNVNDVDVRYSVFGGIFFTEEAISVDDAEYLISNLACQYHSASVTHYVLMLRTFLPLQGSALSGAPFPENRARWQRLSRLFADPSNPFEPQGRRLGLWVMDNCRQDSQRSMGNTAAWLYLQ